MTTFLSRRKFVKAGAAFLFLVKKDSALYINTVNGASLFLH